MAAGHWSVREARGLGNYLAVAASNVVGVLSLVLQAALEACGPCHVTVETPARATVIWTSLTWSLVRKGEESCSWACVSLHFTLLCWATLAQENTKNPSLFTKY